MREATGNLVPVQGEDARPSYPCPPTLMPDGPISLRPHQLDSSTVDCLEGLRSVCPSVSVRSGPSSVLFCLAVSEGLTDVQAVWQPVKGRTAL